jgi:hypothetical protein
LYVVSCISFFSLIHFLPSVLMLFNNLSTVESQFIVAAFGDFFFSFQLNSNINKVWSLHIYWISVC